MVTGGLQTDSEPHPQQQVGSRLDSVPDGPARDGLSAPLTKFLPVVGAGEHHESELICVNMGVWSVPDLAAEPAPHGSFSRGVR